MIAKVVLEIPVFMEFDYIIPENLLSAISPGTMVKVPFRNKILRGYIINISHTSTRPKLKEIISVINEKPALSQNLIKLASWLSEYYLCPLGIVYRSFLPPGVRKNIKGRKDYRVISSLPLDRLSDIAEKMRKKSPKQSSVLRFICSHTEKKEFDMPKLVSAAKCSKQAIISLVEKGVLSLRPVCASEKDEISFPYPLVHEIKLTKEQESSLKKITGSIQKNEFCSYLLHGVTGSGKTEIYINSINHALQHSKGAIVLVPEISLTPQTIDRFRRRISEPLAIIHSGLSDGQRSEQWEKISKGLAKIVIGARSAIFAPVKDLGLIIVDEEHERSYKQEDSPRYNARDVAVMRGKLENAVVVLGSATPSLESYYNTTAGKYKLLSLPNRVDGKTLPSVEVIDMRSDRQNIKLSCSEELAGEIESRISRKEQTILFINRRGFSSSIICPSCGETIKCKNCSISMTYHKSKKSLFCHLCGYHRRLSSVCPTCSNPKLTQLGLGTEKVEYHIQKLFPHAKLLRMDSDTTSFRNAHRKLLTDFANKKYDILIGTQMVAKGLDFPDVTLVGIIFADLSLSLPDFRSAEVTYQLLTQVSGRSGRGAVPGKVIIQTCLPGHYSVTSSAKHSYMDFINKELQFRKELKYPPFTHIINFTISGKNEAHVQNKAEFLHGTVLKNKPDGIDILGPAPAAIQKTKSNFRWQILLKSQNIRKLHETAKELLNKSSSIKGIKISADVDPLSLL
ncbi:primosomal protein N' [bacterium]|jgi:primosomal protein N' (replication factor Y)|nr:primosomal protein N' [bacterium]